MLTTPSEGNLAELHPAYVAGLIDAGANFRQRDRYRGGKHWIERRLWLVTPDEVVGNPLVTQFGGTLRKHPGGWHIEYYAKEKIRAILSYAMPYLITKRQAAEQWL